MVDKTEDSQYKRPSTLNGSRSPEGETGGSRRLSSYLQSVAQISGVVTIIAATVYALGVFTLVLPIAKSYNSTFAAAWYAVSVVPKTVVVGHGIKSLVWPSLALTVATTLFALMVLWVLYVVSIGWRHARQTPRYGLALYLTSLAVIYSLLALLILAGFSALWPAWVIGSGLDLPSSDVAYYAQRSLTFMQVPVDILIVLLCSVIAIFVVAGGLHYMRGLIANRAIPSVSFGGFIFKSLVFVWLTFSVLVSVSRLQGYVTNTTFLDAVDRYASQHPVKLGYFVLPFFLLLLLLAFLVMLFLILKILKGLRFILKLRK